MRGMDGPAGTRILLVDDHELVRAGLRAFLDAEDGLEVVGEAGTARAALAALGRGHPDVVVLDVRLPDGDGVEVCREIRSRHPATRVLMLTSFADEAALIDSILAGASGYVLKATTHEGLVEAIRRVAAGESLIDPAVTAVLFRKLRGQEAAAQPLSWLTQQERRILDLMGEGLTNREIAQRLHLAEQTVKNYVSSVLSKLGLKGRTQAALYISKLAQAQ